MSLEQLLAQADTAMREDRNAEGIAAFRQAIVLSPQRAATHLSLADALHASGQIAPAIESYRHAIELQPGLLRAYFNLSVACREANRIDESIDYLRRALNLSPVHHEAWNDLGILLQMQNRFDEAIVAHQQAIAIQPRWAIGWLNLGNVFYKQRRFDEAMAAFRNSASLEPNFVEAWSNLANALRAMDRLDEAMKACDRALQVMPNSALAMGVRGNILLDRGEIDGVISVFRQTVTLDPSNASSHYNLGMALLLKGEFEEGWRECEWRLLVDPRTLKRPRLTKPGWDGKSDISGKRLLLYTEQGIGDSVQFLRYLPRVSQFNANIILQTAPEFGELAKRCAGIEAVESVNTGPVPMDYDLQYSLLSLPFLVGITLDSIPQTTVPYLRADPQKWNERLKDVPHPRIGLVWAGNPEHLNDRNRSMPLSTLAPLAAVVGATFISLQKGPAWEQTKTSPFPIMDFTSELHNFTDTADLIAALDLVICVDTAVAHIAGAMGKPVWLLLPLVPDWRWMLERADSPWYPSMRLFRQSSRGDWTGPTEAIVRELRSFKMP